MRQYLMPGQAVQYVFDIRKAFEIQQAGKYTLQVSAEPTGSDELVRESVKLVLQADPAGPPVKASEGIVEPAQQLPATQPGEGEQAWGAAVNGLQSGLDFLGYVGESKTKVNLRFRVRNADAKPIRMMPLRLQKDWWGQNLPLDVKHNGQLMKYRGPVVEPPPPPPIDAFGLLDRGQIDSVEVEGDLTNWGLSSGTGVELTFAFFGSGKDAGAAGVQIVEIEVWSGTARSNLITFPTPPATHPAPIGVSTQPAVAPAGEARWGKAVNGYACGLSSPAANTVVLAIKNISKEKLYFYTLLDVEGNRIGLTSYVQMKLIDSQGRDAKGIWGGLRIRPMRQYLMPGQAVQYLFDIRKAFKIEQAGKYTLQVSAEPTWSNGLVLESVKLVLQADPAGPPVKASEGIVEPAQQLPATQPAPVSTQPAAALSPAMSLLLSANSSTKALPARIAPEPAAICLTHSWLHQTNIRELAFLSVV